VDDNKILTGVHCIGLDLSVLDDRLTLIGILENVKQVELSKINTYKSASFNNKPKKEDL
jgi:hypothetical protein